MAKSKQAKSAVPYVQQLVEDEYVQQQLRTAAARLREAYGRASRKRGKAAEDKKFYDNLRDAVTSTRRAALALQRRQPEPKRRGRKLLLVAVAGGGAVVILRGPARKKLQSAFSKESPAPAAGDGAQPESAVGSEAPPPAPDAPSAA
jgi:hypothetical protein